MDLAISVPPSFEIVGESAANLIKLRVRIRYAVRVKVPAGIASSPVPNDAVLTRDAFPPGVTRST